jgi:hypothetical protein
MIFRGERYFEVIFPLFFKMEFMMLRSDIVCIAIQCWNFSFGVGGWAVAQFWRERFH